MHPEGRCYHLLRIMEVTSLEENVSLLITVGNSKCPLPADVSALHAPKFL